MKIIILVALAILAVYSQNDNCKICAQAQTCPKELFSDGDIDAIFNSLIQQIKITSPPVEISKASNTTHSNYTFRWVSKIYVAVVDLTTRNYKIFSFNDQKTENNLASGTRQTMNKRNIANQVTIFKRIDQQIRERYSLSQQVKCLSLNFNNGMYSAKYSKPDGSLLNVDVKVVQQKGSVTIVILNQQNNQSTVKKTSSQSNSQQNNQQNKITTSTATVESAQQPQQRAQPPKFGGYSKIQQPNKDPNVINIINYLVKQFGEVFKLLKIITIQNQVVSGLNYRFTAVLDSTSNARYIIVIYQDIQGKLSITQSNLINVSPQPSFQIVYPAAEANKLSYFPLLLKALNNAKQQLIPKDAALQSFSINYPYFKLTFQSKVQGQLTIVLSYDILSNTLKVISFQQTLTYPPEKKQPIVPTPQPIAKPEAKPIAQPQAKQQTQTSSNQKRDSQVKTIQKPVVTSSNSFVQDGYSYAIELISEQLKSSNLFKGFIKHFVSEHVGKKEVLFAIYYKIENNDDFVFRIKKENGEYRDQVFTLNYIKNLVNKLSNANNQQQLQNCLEQQNNICLRCAYSYYVVKGKCAPVQVECSEFNYKTLKCDGCYHGYYLDLSGVCRLADYLCRTSDRKGNCITCYNDYRLTARGKCVFNAEGVIYDLHEQQNNPLCSKFNKLQCLSCVRGCYLNKLGFCRIPDPNCHKFNQQNEVCTICMQGYSLSLTTKTCVPNRSYC